MTASATRLASTRHYPARLEIVGVARRQAVSALRKWRVPVRHDDLALVMSELLSNAVRMSGLADQIKVSLRWTGAGLAIGVWDSCADLPVLATSPIPGDITPDPTALDDGDRVGGWGLQLVQSVATAFQTRRTSSPAGKWVIALLPAASPQMALGTSEQPHAQ